MLTIRQGHSAPIEVDAGQDVRALTFTANGKYLVTGGDNGAGVWRVKDRTQVARMEMRDRVLSLATSKNGEWIAAGTLRGMVVWNAETFEQVLKHEEGDFVNAVDFSPDSTRLVAGTDNKRAIVWDLATGKQVQILRHQNYVRAAKYSPRGDRIATAEGYGPVRVWDSSNGRLLFDINVTVTSWYNTGLVWSNDHLFVASDKKIEEFDASTGSTVSEWPVPDIKPHSCIALPKHEGFIAFSAERAVTFWDLSTHDRLLTLQHPQDIRSIAFSPDDRIIAIGGGSKITPQSLSSINVRATFCRAISSLNSFPAPASSSSVSPTSYFPRTRHSSRRRCTRLVEARSTRRRRSVIDCVDQPVAESESSPTR